VVRKTTLSVDGQSIEFTNLDKVLFPETGTTKGDVLGYYAHVAPLLIEQAAWRPATLKRWVNGVGTATDPESSFFQKNLGASPPPWVKHFPIEHSDHTNEYPLVNDAATLAWLTQLAALEIHTPQWRFGPRGARRKPDRLVIDLDPGEGVELTQCAAVALVVRERLTAMNLDPMPVTSGSKGIHIYAALDETRPSETISSLAHELAKDIEKDHSDLVVSDMARKLRAGKVLIDWSQNNGAKTTVTPYSLRGRARPTVATPRTWDEIASTDLAHLEYTEVLTRMVEGHSDVGAKRKG
jgi:bifunctional non-homologous end joining protein LigD